MCNVQGEPERLAVAFDACFVAAGIDVPIGATLTFARALENLGVAHRTAVYWAGRATLLTRPEQAITYDRAFGVFWSRIVVGDAAEETIDEVVLALDVPSGGRDEPEGAIRPGVPVVSIRWSPTEVLRRRDFAAYTPAEFVEARKLMADLRFAGARRPSRRRRRTSRARGTPDVRRTVRRALRARWGARTTRVHGGR